VEKLTTLPELHPQERQAIEDALRGLNFLKREDSLFDAEKEQRAIEQSLEKLRSVGPVIKRVSEDAEPE
jgi:hypothetical protein